MNEVRAAGVLEFRAAASTVRDRGWLERDLPQLISTYAHNDFSLPLAVAAATLRCAELPDLHVGRAATSRTSAHGRAASGGGRR